MYDFGLRGNLPIFIFNFLAVRYFNVRIGHSSSHKFIQDQGVPQGSVLSVTLFNIHMSNILHQLPPSVRGMLYVDDLQVSCQGSDMRLIERQLQTTVNRLVQWCDQNGHTISPSKSNCVHFCRKRNLHPDPSIHIGHIQIPVVSAVHFLGVIFDCKLTFLPHVLYLRKRCERSLNILKVLSNTLWGADRVSLLRVYHALILSRLDYGCAVYGSARASVLKRLDTIHHSALRICSGAFRTSPVTSLYVVCHQPPLELRRRQLCANYFIRAMSVPSHPLKPFALAIGLNRLYEARSFNIKPFSERAKAVLNDAHLNHINIQENNIFAFPPWDIQIFNYHNPFSGYDKADTAAVIYQQLFSFHRNKYSKYIPVYTDGSKTAAHVGCGVIFNNTILSFSLHNSMSVFSAELTAILVALQHIIVSNHRHFCVYTDSMSALESLHFSTEHRHPTVIEILLLLRKLERKGFDVIFSWVPGHVGILGNEQADTAARSMSGHMQRPVCYRDLKTSTQNYIHRVWQETWDQQILNKLHNIHPSTSHWAALPMRRHDVRLTRLRIGHTRFTHRHLLLGENAPECPSCKVPYSVYHILIDCPIFNCHRITFFHTSVLTLSDLQYWGGQVDSKDALRGLVPRSVIGETGDRPYKSAKLAHLDVTVAPHANLNFSRGVISPADFLNVSTEEIKENMQAQNVCDVRRITIRRDGQVLNTKHLILTFNTPDLPQTVKMAYIRCPVRPYIPNPLRCFQCQRFGHSKTVCRGQPTCSRCAEVGHDSADCKAKERCVNCKGDHSSFSRSCPTWLLEKEITAIKIKIKFRIRRLGVLYRHARQFLEKAMRRRPEKHTYQQPFK
ncbi:uncharacterized protein TNCV_701831 [Trichonephila clavipes]|nr:uncharacterized protein TNCV_701831 [Trichonephila clavipes]